MGILSGLKVFGFKNEKSKIFEESESDEIIKSEKQEEKKRIVVDEATLLFPKTYKCPICDHTFKSLSVRSGKTRNVGQDQDLRPRFKDIDPIKYDAIVCPECGYAAIARYFDYVMPIQAKKIRKKIMSSFSGITLSKDKYSYEEALTHYKLVLMSDVVGDVPNSRKAYTCLKMAWVIRGWLESGENGLTQERIEELKESEQECIQNAYDGYIKAFSTEAFPMSGMDEMTLSYLLAQLAFSLGKYKDSVRMLSNILGNKNVSDRIKDKAVLLKEQIRDTVK